MSIQVRISNQRHTSRPNKDKYDSMAQSSNTLFKTYWISISPAVPCAPPKG
jgi:hypothetical protein